jgi:hypothetical protein
MRHGAASAADAVGHAFTKVPSLATEALKGLPNALETALIKFPLSAGAFLLGAGLHLGLQLLGGITHALPGIISFFQVTVPQTVGHAMASAGTWLLNHGVQLMSGLYKGILSAAHATFNFFTSTVPSTIHKAFSSVGSWLTQHGQTLMDGFKKGIDTGARAVWNFFSTTLPHTILSYFSSVGSWLTGSGNDSMVGFLAGIGRGAVAVGQWFLGLPGQILRWIGNASTWLINVGSDLIHGLWNGITSAAGWLEGKVKGLVGTVTGWFKKGWESLSPSMVFHRIGVDNMTGLANGMTAAVTSHVIPAINDITTSVTSATSKWIKAATPTQQQLSGTVLSTSLAAKAAAAADLAVARDKAIAAQKNAAAQVPINWPVLEQLKAAGLSQSQIVALGASMHQPPVNWTVLKQLTAAGLTHDQIVALGASMQAGGQPGPQAHPIFHGPAYPGGVYAPVEHNLASAPGDRFAPSGHGGDLNITIYNPQPDAAESSIHRTMQKIKFHGLLPQEAWDVRGATA